MQAEWEACIYIKPVLPLNAEKLPVLLTDRYILKADFRLAFAMFASLPRDRSRLTASSMEV